MRRDGRVAEGGGLLNAPEGAPEAGFKDLPVPLWATFGAIWAPWNPEHNANTQFRYLLIIPPNHKVN
jgi:hypothetical protein